MCDDGVAGNWPGRYCKLHTMPFGSSSECPQSVLITWRVLSAGPYSTACRTESPW